MSKTYIPDHYAPLLNLYDTQKDLSAQQYMPQQRITLQ